MKNKLTFISSIFLMTLLTLSGCTSPLAIFAPTATPTLTPTNTPAPTLIPTKTPRPTATKRPTATPIACVRDDVLKDLKESIPEYEFTVGYNTFNSSSTLVFWYVDPNIDANGGNAALEDNQGQAIVTAATMVFNLSRYNPCVKELFDYINPIIVDSNYHGWVSGRTFLSVLPEISEPSNADILAISKLMEINYLQDTAPVKMSVAPKGSCTWQETERKIRQHFASDRQNVNFYFVIDDGGTNIWAQWDGPTDEIIVAVNIANIAMELDCLYPRPTQLIYIVVDEEGVIGDAALLPLTD